MIDDFHASKKVVITGPPGPAEGRPEDKLDPAIQRTHPESSGSRRSWIAGSSPAMTLVVGRDAMD